MSDVDIDAEFDGYRRTREPERLARVFDATAPSLLLVALHLTRDEASAHDIVQTTFLRLIEKGDGWDSTRPLRPWMHGILSNEVAMWWRRRQRMKDAVPTPAPPLDPADQAEVLEAVDAVTRALQGLPEHYRAVIRLRMMHGFTSPETGRVLDLSPETVRTRTRRGLDILRAALPPSLATIAMPLLVTRELNDVRAVLMARAFELHATNGGTVAAGWNAKGTASHRTLETSAARLGVLLVALVATTVGVARFTLTPDRRESATSSPAREKTQADLSLLKPARSDDVATQIRLPAANDAHPSSTNRSAPEPIWRVAGRIIDATGVPIGGADVEVDLVRGPVEERIAEVRSADDGTWSADLEPARDLSVLQRANASIFVRASAPRFAFDEGDWILDLPILADEIFHPTLDRRLTRDLLVVGTVVDESGRPLEGVEVTVRDDQGATLEEKTTERDGSYRLRRGRATRGESHFGRGPSKPISSLRGSLLGDVVISAYSPDVGGATIRVAEVGSVRGALPPLQLRSRHAIHLRVVMPDGKPAEDLWVHVSAGEMTQAPREWQGGEARVQVDRDGLLRVEGLNEGEWKLRIDPPFEMDFGLCPERTADTSASADVWTIGGHLVRVAVRDPEGEPLRGAAVGVMLWRGTELSNAPPDGRDYGVSPHRDGVVAFLLPNDCRARFSVRIAGSDPTSIDVELAGGGGRRDLPLVVSPTVGAGRFALRVTDQEGAKVDDYTYDVRLEDRFGLFETTLEGDSNSLSPDGLSCRLPVGAYQILVTPTSIDELHAREEVITLSDGEVTPVELVLPAARFASVTLSSPSETIHGLAAMVRDRDGRELPASIRSEMSAPYLGEAKPGERLWVVEPGPPLGLGRSLHIVADGLTSDWIDTTFLTKERAWEAVPVEVTLRPLAESRQ